jgi:hypothetical protein
VGKEEEEEVMLPDDRLQQIILSKDVDNAVYEESWAIIDNALVIYDGNDPPHWLPTEAERDEDGNTKQFVERSSVGS